MIKPVNDRVVIARDPAEEKVGSLYLPANAQEKPFRGTVVAIGPGKPNDAGGRDPMQVAVGDRVLIGKYTGTEVEVSGEAYVVCREDDILGVLEE